MTLINAIFRLFGYEWVKDETPIEREHDSLTLEADEGWDDLYQHSPRYKLQKIQPN